MPRGSGTMSVLGGKVLSNETFYILRGNVKKLQFCLKRKSNQMSAQCCIVYSNHLNTEHPKSERSTFSTLFCSFRYSYHLLYDNLIRQTIQISDIFTISCPVFRPPFENRTIWQPDMIGPFDYQTCLVFRWLLYLHYNMFL